MADDPQTVTEILRAVREGEAGAADRLYERVYGELLHMARARARDEGRSGATPTSIVHEAYLRLLGNVGDLTSRAHFFGSAAEAMRRILIDAARERLSLKRGAAAPHVSLHDTAAVGDVPPAELLDVDRALTRLEQRDEAMAAVVKLRYFAGMTVPETAEALGTSPRSVDRQWSAARAWLQREMKRGAS